MPVVDNGRDMPVGEVRDLVLACNRALRAARGRARRELSVRLAIA